jgi:hypothetical protein
MYARVVVFSHDEDRDQLEEKAPAAVIPIVTSSPGYISYGVMFQTTRSSPSARGSQRSTPRRRMLLSVNGCGAIRR